MRRWLILALALSLCAQAAEDSSPAVYVFLPSNVRPHAMQSQLSVAYPNLDLTVFGRFSEFKRRITEDPPDAILSLGPVIVTQFQYLQRFQGTRAGKASESFILLSVGEPIELSNDVVIGVIDLLGRKSMRSFMKKLLNLDQLHVRTVSKVEDLLTLLQFQDVDAILIPQSIETYFLNRSRLKLVKTPLYNANIELPSIAVRKGREALITEIRAQLKNTNADATALLGVDAWSED